MTDLERKKAFADEMVKLGTKEGIEKLAFEVELELIKLMHENTFDYHQVNAVIEYVKEKLIREMK